MKLNIYEKHKVVKTYEADSYDLMFGTVEDVAAAVNLDKIQAGTDAEIIRAVGEMVIGSMDLVKDLLKDLFPGITDEEIRKTKTTEIAKVLVEVVIFTIGRIHKTFAGGGPEKN